MTRQKGSLRLTRWPRCKNKFLILRLWSAGGPILLCVVRGERPYSNGSSQRSSRALPKPQNPRRLYWLWMGFCGGYLQAFNCFLYSMLILSWLNCWLILSARHLPWPNICRAMRPSLMLLLAEIFSANGLAKYPYSRI